MKQKLKEIRDKYLTYIIWLSYVIVVMILGFFTARSMNWWPVVIDPCDSDCKVFSQVVIFCERGIKESDWGKMRPIHNKVCTKYWDYVTATWWDNKEVLKEAKKYGKLFIK